MKGALNSLSSCQQSVANRIKNTSRKPDISPNACPKIKIQRPSSLAITRGSNRIKKDSAEERDPLKGAMEDAIKSSLYFLKEQHTAATIG